MTFNTCQIVKDDLSFTTKTSLEGVYKCDKSVFGDIKYVQIKGKDIILTTFIPSHQNNGKNIEVPSEHLQFTIKGKQITTFDENNVIRYVFTTLPDGSIVENEGNFTYTKVK